MQMLFNCPIEEGAEMTTKGFGPELKLDGRWPTDYERETLTIMQEELAEVIVAISKMLRFGVGQTNPVTEVKNDVEFCMEIGHMYAMLDRVAALPFYDRTVINRGFRQKVEKLVTFTQFAPEQVAGE